MAFYESPRFPDYLAYGLVVSPMFATDIVRVNSGHESSNARWNQAIRMFDGATTHRTQAQKDEIDNFFHAVARGRANRFRIKDVTDYTDGGFGVLTAISGSPSNTYQLGKRATSGAQTYTRDIRKPIDPVSVSGGGTYSIDYTTGVLTHTAGAAPTAWTGEFDCAVRFDHDELEWEVAARSGSSILYIARELRLIEVRV